MTKRAANNQRDTTKQESAIEDNIIIAIIVATVVLGVVMFFMFLSLRNDISRMNERVKTIEDHIICDWQTQGKYSEYFTECLDIRQAY